MNMQRTVRLAPHPNAEQSAVLLETMRRPTKSEKDRKASCPTAELVPIRYDARTYSIRDGQADSGLSSVNRQRKIPFVSNPHAQSIRRRAAGFDSAALIAPSTGPSCQPAQAG